MSEIDTRRAQLDASPFKRWLLSDSIVTYLNTAIVFGCLTGAIAALKGEELSVGAALPFSGLILVAMALNVTRAFARRDTLYGFSLAWKMALAAQAIIMASLIGMVVLVLQGSDSVDELWSLLVKGGMAVPIFSALLRTDPRG